MVETLDTVLRERNWYRARTAHLIGMAEDYAKMVDELRKVFASQIPTEVNERAKKLVVDDRALLELIKRGPHHVG